MATTAAGRVLTIVTAALCACGAVLAQGAWETGLDSGDPAERLRAVRALRESGDAPNQLNRLAGLISDPSDDVREAVISTLIRVGGRETHPMLIEATKDPLPALQAVAVEALVNTYLPGYVRTGRLSGVRSLASSVKGRLTNPTPTVLPTYVQVDADVPRAIGAVLQEGRNADARATAARALGVLRAGAERDALLSGVRSRDAAVVIESSLAFKKIEDESVGPELVFLLRDPERSVQEAACEALGQLRTVEAIPALIRVVEDSRWSGTRAKALEALAKIPDRGGRDRFLQYLEHKDRFMRRAAAEGLGRIGDPVDLPRIRQRLSREKAGSARLALAFAAVRLGDPSGLEYLLRALDSLAHRFEARAYLEELAREQGVRQWLYATLSAGTEDQRKHLAAVLGASGGEDTLPHLEERTRDSNAQVAQSAMEALRALRARLM